jgi:hypothetical protein
MLYKNVKIKICRTTIILLVLYGSKTWSLVLREEHRLRVFENRVLWGISGPNRDEATRGMSIKYPEGASSSDSDVHLYVIITKLLGSLYVIRCEPKSPYRKYC